MRSIHSYLCGRWRAPDSAARPLTDATSGEVFARAGHAHVDAAAILGYAQDVGRPALSALSFHDRAAILKAAAKALGAHKALMEDLSFHTGATHRDHAFDIDGGIGTTAVFASIGQRELPHDGPLLDGPPVRLSSEGGFWGQHIYTPKAGVAVHINAYNFPLWGMMEKFAPAFLAGVPCIVKPATSTCQVAEAAVRILAPLLPPGALQLVCGGLGDVLDHLGGQDSVAFTGSAATAQKLRATPALIENAVAFTAEQDSLNATVLGSDVHPDTPQFDAFITECAMELTVKAGQKCTAIRRIIVPGAMVGPVATALSARLEATPMGDPRDPATRLGPLVSRAQRQDVEAKCAEIAAEATLLTQAGETDGAFLAPRLYLCEAPDDAHAVHATEAFGPVATLMPARDLSHACALAARGGGSLVVSLATADPEIAREGVLAMAPHHGRLYLTEAATAAEATGHGAPMPQMVHGGPGRAGGGEELGGLRAVKHNMQRSAVQGSPKMLAALTGRHMRGAPQAATPSHPFTCRWGDLHPGDVLRTEAREITLADIEHFAAFTGDTFYAHMDAAAAARNPFFPGRVAHGYLLLSFAAGLFVEPTEGPVLANTGLDRLRFRAPVSPGDTIRVELTVQEKSPRTDSYGEVRWEALIFNQNDTLVAEYVLLTMVAH
ncbi:MAG: phenylacetic acid degradation bifunctional protein PaaZ [Shimia sp.]